MEVRGSSERAGKAGEKDMDRIWEDKDRGRVVILG